jgi:hypothetical protein
MALLATLSDFVRLGIPATALVPPPREIELVDTSTGRVLTKGHGLISGDQLRFEAQGTLPAPLVATAIYTATPVDLDLFTVDLSGVAVVLTSTGTKPYSFRVDPRPAIEQALAAASATVQDHATAHSELSEVTEQVKQIVCVLAADIVVSTNRLRLPLTDKFFDNHTRKLSDAWITLRTWQSGRAIAGVKDATPTIAESGAIAGGPKMQPGGFKWGVGL